jgi:hypothetical protein
LPSKYRSAILAAENRLPLAAVAAKATTSARTGSVGRVGLDPTNKKRRAEIVVNAVLGGVVAVALVAFVVMLVGAYAAYAAKRVVAPGA